MEYLIVELTKNADDDTDTINEEAADGWELMQMIVVPGFGFSGPSLKALFRRPESSN